MPWKLDHIGERGYHRHDPEKIQEMDPDTVTAFGVELNSRTGQVREMVAMLAAVDDLHSADRDTLALIQSIFWDSKNCCMTVTMRPGLPWGWIYDDAKELGHRLQAHGCPWNIMIEAGQRSYEVEGIEE